MKMPQISNPEKTILISKQVFAEKIAQCAAVIIMDHEELIPLFAKFMTMVTISLFEEDIDDLEDDDDD